MSKVRRYIYKISSLIPDKPYYYIGQHKTTVKNDTYFGSGVKWLDVLQKYGKENFEKIIIAYLETDEELNEAEIKEIGALYKTDKWCCNLCGGGNGSLGYELSEESKQRISSKTKGRKHTPEEIEKIREASIGRGHSEETKRLLSEKAKQRHREGKYIEGHRITGQKNKGRIQTEEEKTKRAEANRGKKRSIEFCQRMSELNTGRKMSQETKDKLSKAHKGKKLLKNIGSQKRRYSLAKDNFI